jgi:hypothetical protein
MNEWKCTIKTPSNWLQTIRVEAYTHSDAVAFAESQTGGKCIMAVLDNSYTSDDDGDVNSGDSGVSMDGGFILAVVLIVFLVYAWKWILLIGGIALLIWAAIHFSRE